MTKKEQTFTGFDPAKGRDFTAGHLVQRHINGKGFDVLHVRIHEHIYGFEPVKSDEMTTRAEPDPKDMKKYESLARHLIEKMNAYPFEKMCFSEPRTLEIKGEPDGHMLLGLLRNIDC